MSPASTSNEAVTLESTPPDMAMTMRDMKISLTKSPKGLFQVLLDVLKGVSIAKQFQYDGHPIVCVLLNPQVQRGKSILPPLRAQILSD